jgi:LPS-assembly protein
MSAAGLTFMLSLAVPAAFADEPPCPDNTAVVGTPLPPRPKSDAAHAPITIESDDNNFEFDVNGNARVCGNVVMKQGDRHVHADCLEYNSKDQSAKLTGGIEYTDPVLTVRGNNGTYSPTLGADFQGTQFELPERGARGAARNLRADANGKVTLQGVTFTTCPANQVNWQLDADEIEIDTRARTGTGHGTKVEFKGVPILYLPWMTFPVGPQRKSGFLFPNIGASSRNGAVFELPYYWNIRPNLDFTAEPVYYSKRGVDLAGEMRYLTDRQRGTFEFNYLPNDDLANRDRTRFKLEHVAELPGEWRFRIDATDVSDTNYFEDFARGPEGTSVPFAERLAEASYRDEHLNLRAQIQDFQTIDDEVTDEDRPYTRAPRLLASGDWNMGLGDIDYGFDAELVNFRRDVDQTTLAAFPDAGVRGWRLDVAPHAGFDWSAPGFFVRPTIGYRYTQYSLDDRAPGNDDAPTRSLPFATLDAGLVFERETGSHAQRRITLEPRALYLYTPFRDQNQLPLFDTGLPDLNLVQLYRTNRYVGADRVNDANQIAFGLTSRLFDSASGAQYLAVSVGQAYYFEKPRVVLPDEPPATRDTSDFIGQLSLTAYRNWNLEAGLQWNPEDSRSERSQIRLQYRPDGEHVVNLAYRAQRDRIEQVDTSVAWPIGKRFNAFGRYVYSLLDSKTLDEFAGFEYKACCYKLRAVARRSVSNRDGTSETEFYLQLELNGLASVGTSADAFLERTIRGYSRETSLPGKPTP